MHFSGLAGTLKHILALVILALAACQPAIDTSTLPVPETWRVQITPALRWLGPVLNECTRQVPGVALLYDEEPVSSLNLGKADFAFSLAEPVEGAAYSAVLGQVGAVVIVNPANPVAQLEQASLEAMFNGKIITWSDLPQQDCPGCTAPAQSEIRPYVYAAGDDFGQGISDLFPGLSQRLPAAILAPDPEALRQAVAADPQAVGFIPTPVVDSSVRVVRLSNAPVASLRIPLLLSSQAEPAGIKRSWVLCIQDNLPK